MPDLRTTERMLWASELLGAQVVSRGHVVAWVTGLVMQPPRGLRALRVRTGHPDILTDAADLFLPFDAALDYAPGVVQVLSADDLVQGDKVPSLLGHSSSALPDLGAPVRTVSGELIGYLWDVCVDSVTGELVKYRLGPHQHQLKDRGVLTSYKLCACLQGELTVQDEAAALLQHLLSDAALPLQSDWHVAS